jgi:multiple sugar transport system permease protein
MSTQPAVIRESDVSLHIRRVVSYIVLIFLACLCLFPFLFLAIYATRSNEQILGGFSLVPGKYFMENLKNVLTYKQFPVYIGMLNSLIVSVSATALCVYFSAFTAYGIHVYDFKVKRGVYTFILMVMMVPTQVSTLGFIDMVFALDLVDTFWPLIIPSIAAPSILFFMKQYMEASLPIEIVEAARIDGCNELRIFNTIITPILQPAFAVQAIFVFVGNWNNYFLPQLLLTDKNKQTLPVLIALVRNASPSDADQGKSYMYIAFAILPVVIIYLFLSKFIIRGVTLGAVKG